MKNILVLGSGGREHALGWNLKDYNDGNPEGWSRIHFMPGNGGTAEHPWGKNVAIDPTKAENHLKILEYAICEHIDLVVVGPETPLARGIVNFFQANNFPNIFGPTACAAELESDKFRSYDIMNATRIPQARGFKCYTAEEALRAIDSITALPQAAPGVVIKAKGLAGGKGVRVCTTNEQAQSELEEHVKEFGEQVLISERLQGPEFSIFGLSDGTHVLPLEIAVQDHKRLLDGNNGPNTGGMGAYGPVPFVSRELIENIGREILTPTVQYMNQERCPYVGFIYAGMMMTKQGPKVLEFNCRLGDPETQVLAMLLKTSLYEPIMLALKGKVNEAVIEYNSGAAVCVVLASKGYPSSNITNGLPIFGLETTDSQPGTKVFHAGTKRDKEKILTNGGRVLGVTALSSDLGDSNLNYANAQEAAYKAVNALKIEGGFAYRKDIGSI